MMKKMKIENMEDLLEFLEDEQKAEFNSSWDYEEAIMDDDTYKRLQFKKYGYAVSRVTYEEEVINGQKEFKEVAESSSSIGEKKQTLRDLRMATQEREQEERNYNEQGE